MKRRRVFLVKHSKERVLGKRVVSSLNPPDTIIFGLELLRDLKPSHLGDIDHFRIVVIHAESGFDLFSVEAIAEGNQRRLVVSLATAIRQAWTAPDAESRDWKMFILRRQVLSFYYAEDKWPTSPPPFTPLQQALRYLQTEGQRARRCANAECSAPYFLSKRRNQKFCGDDCALPARLEAKRRWWDNKRGKKEGAR